MFFALHLIALKNLATDNIQYTHQNLIDSPPLYFVISCKRERPQKIGSLCAKYFWYKYKV